MKKDAYYFPHKSNQRNDIRIRRLRKELHCDGYGIYNMVLEVLIEQPGFKYPLSGIDLLADEFGTSEQKLRTVICNYGLFQVDEQEMFFSLEQIESMQPYIEKSERAKSAAAIRWGVSKKSQSNDNQLLNNANADANAMQMQCVGNADAMQEEKRREENKREKKEERKKAAAFTPPSPEEVKVYFSENGYSEESAIKFHTYYELGNWADSKGNKVRNWKQKAQAVWFKDENKKSGAMPNRKNSEPDPHAGLRNGKDLLHKYL